MTYDFKKNEQLIDHIAKLFLALDQEALDDMKSVCEELFTLNRDRDVKPISECVQTIAEILDPARFIDGIGPERTIE